MQPDLSGRMIKVSEAELEVHKALSSHEWEFIAWYRRCTICGRIEWLNTKINSWVFDEENWVKTAYRLEKERVKRLGFDNILQDRLSVGLTG